MGGHWTDKFSFSTGAVFSKKRGYLVMTDDKLARDQVAHAFFVHWDNGKWGAVDAKWSSPSVTVVEHPKKQMVAIGELGQAKVAGGGDVHDEIIVDGEIKSEDRGTLRCVRSIEGKAYAAGM